MLLPASRPMLGCLLFAGLGAIASTHAAEPDSLEELVVVGSRIPQSQEQAVPVTVVTSEKMQQRGYTTVQQALDDLVHNSGGGFDQQLGLSFTPSASGLNLRDLGVGRALILLDGRRLPMFPIGWNGTDSFVDLSSIPAAAVDRIEVLSEGASAIYGSDAMSGVINIVLKRRADNELGLRYGDTTQGGGAEKRVQLSTGAESDTAHASLFVEYYDREPLWLSQRERTRSDRLGGINGSGPGTFSDYGYLGTFESYNTGDTYRAGTCDTSSGSPGVDTGGYCEFNRAAYRQAWPDVSSLSATAKFDQQLGDAFGWFAMLSLRDAKTTTQMEPLDFNSLDSGVVLFAGDPNNPTGDDVIVYRRMLELGAQQTTYDNQAYNAHVGINGRIMDRIDWQLGLQAARLQLQQSDTGQILNTRMFDALYGLTDFNGDGVNDYLDLSKPIPAAVAAQLEYRPVSNSESTLRGADLQFSSELFAMPAGRARLAGVIEYFEESYADDPDPELIDANVGYRAASAAAGERGHSAAGLELQLPVFSQLQLNLAGRYDSYHDDSEVGSAFSPRAAVEYRPVSGLLFRASAGRSFRAPDLQRLFGGTTSGYQEYINTPQCLDDGGSGRGDASVASCVTPVFAGVSTGPNLQLQEERGTNYGFGVFWKPTANWSASLDFFAIELEQLVETPDGQYVVDQYALNGSFADAVLPFDPVDCPFTDFCLSLQPVNIAYKKVSGVDVAMDYEWSTGLGRFSAGINASYLFKVEMRESALRDPVDVLSDGQLGEAVELKGGVDLGWSRNAWAANVFVNYIGGFTPLDTTTQKHLGSFTTVNVNAAYTFRSRASVQLGINNLFDRMPPVDMQRADSSQPFYHQQFHHVDGASWFVNYRQPF